MTNGSLMKVESTAECSLKHSAILLTCIQRFFGLLFKWLLKTGFTVMVIGLVLRCILWEQIVMVLPNHQDEAISDVSQV